MSRFNVLRQFGLILDKYVPRLSFKLRASLRSKGYEPEVQLIKYLGDGGIAIDVGGNRGYYAYQMKQYFSGCHVFEPNPNTVKQLRAGLRGDAEVHAVALSDRHGESELRIPIVSGVDTVGRATIESTNNLFEQEYKTVCVPMQPLDDFTFEKVSLLKIDVEGHEMAVLNGAVKTIHDSSPTMIVESEERQCPGTVAEVFSFMHSNNYIGFYMLDQTLYKLDLRLRDPENANTYQGQFINNFVFVKKQDALCALQQFIAEEN